MIDQKRPRLGLPGCLPESTPTSRSLLIVQPGIDESGASPTMVGLRASPYRDGEVAG